MLEDSLIGLAVIFFSVIVGGIIANRFKQPIGIGLLLVGAIIGPYALNLMNDEKMITMMADFGAILLLFVIGLEFVLPRLAKIGFKVFLMGILKIGITFFIGYETLMWMGVQSTTAMLLGTILSISSTVVIVKVLKAKELYKREEMPLLIGILIVEDIFSVIVLTLISKSQGSASIMSSIEGIIIALTLLTIAYFVMLKVSRVLISWFMKHSGEEAITFIALAVCVGFSYFASFLGLSPAIGAFLAGSIVASLPNAKVFEESIRPYTDLFSALFFISVGTMVNFLWVKDNLAILGVLLLIVIVSRFIGVGFIGYVFSNFKKEQVVFASLAMLSVGEFPLLIAHTLKTMNLGLDLVSLSGSLVLITALIMSISIGFYGHVSNVFNQPKSRGWIAKSESLSGYMRSLSEELDIESSNTRYFKQVLGKTLLMALGVLLVLIGWRRLLGFVIEQSLSLWIAYGAGVIVLGLVTLLLKHIYNNSKKMHKSLVIILAGLDGTGTTSRSRAVLNQLMATFGLLLIALASPVILAILRLPLWTNVIPLALIIGVAIKFRQVVSVIHESRFTKEFPKYKKLSEVRPAYNVETQE